MGRETALQKAFCPIGGGLIRKTLSKPEQALHWDGERGQMKENKSKREKRERGKLRQTGKRKRGNKGREENKGETT